MKIRQPCANCPWRVDAPRGYWHPDHFRQIWKTCQDDGTAIMQCHKSRRGCARPCFGWARVMGFDAIGVRLAVMLGQIELEEVNATDGPELFETFNLMMRANGVRPPKRNRMVPRRPR